jgi:hypothetical protein
VGRDSPMRRSLVIGTLLLALLPASAVAKCHFACVAHKVTGLHYLALELRAELGEAEERLDQQATAIEGLRGYVTASEARNVQLATWASGFQRCLGEVPISRYGQEQGPSGYVFQLQGTDGPFTLPTTALDVTYDPDPVGAWIWANTCNRERITPQSALVLRGLGREARYGGS